MANSEYDIVVIGGGNAALCAAITARHTGAKVQVLEAALIRYRGLNLHHTRNYQRIHDVSLCVYPSLYGLIEY